MVSQGGMSYWQDGPPYPTGSTVNGVVQGDATQQAAAGTDTPLPPPASGGGGGGGAAGGGQFYQDENDFVRGQDGHIYQRQREGFRTTGWRDLGTDEAAAAATSGMNQQVMHVQLAQQDQQMAQIGWNAQVAANGKTNLQNQQEMQAAGAAYDSQKYAYQSSASPVAGQTMQQYEQGLNTNKDILSGANTAYDTAHLAESQRLQDTQRPLAQANADYDTANFGAAKAYETSNRGLQQANVNYETANLAGDQHLKDVNRTYGTAEGEYNLSRMDAQHNYQDVTRNYGTQEAEYNLANMEAQHRYQNLTRDYGTQETQYNLQHIQDQHSLQDMQRGYGLKDYGYKLLHQAQTQAQDLRKLNQTGIDQTDAVRNRDLEGWGYAAMAQGAKLNGQ